eukprot:TRINITY_DN2471_c0_g1_i1.p1 TRINITY_DN2471_c0_g1~~TRINITY_DN2471_c0_g1_i1.p1  ORF type:complete len:432 (-),score=134.42 TRINITY_DN2471_c0_g1_i1:194-1420(-)
MENFFENIKEAPADPILGLTQAYKADKHPDALNLGVGAYRDSNAKPWPLPVVLEAERRLADTQHVHEYLPISGFDAFNHASARFCLGPDHPSIVNKRYAALQALSGTGSLRVAAMSLKRFCGMNKIFIPNPTWGNHKKIFAEAGLEVNQYVYLEEGRPRLDFEGMCESLRKMPRKSIVLLHACAHNPTGVDPNKEQWRIILDIVRENGLFPMFDSAYQGFATGDPDEDAFAVRLFAQANLDMFVCQSYSKNFGLYCQRAGCLLVLSSTPEACKAMASNIKLVIRPMYSNPPAHGARIVELVLNDPALLAQWKGELLEMANRIKDMRVVLKKELDANSCPGNWDHIINQIGMFSFTGLSAVQVQHLTSDHHIYLTKDGRISMAGLNDKTCKYLANAMKDVITRFQTARL